MKLTKRTSHKTLLGSRWTPRFEKRLTQNDDNYDLCLDVEQNSYNYDALFAEHVVAFVGHDSLYCIVDTENGNVPFYSDIMQDVIEELKLNYESMD